MKRGVGLLSIARSQSCSRCPGADEYDFAQALELVKRHRRRWFDIGNRPEPRRGTMAEHQTRGQSGDLLEDAGHPLGIELGRCVHLVGGGVIVAVAGLFPQIVAETLHALAFAQ